MFPSLSRREFLRQAAGCGAAAGGLRLAETIGSAAEQGPPKVPDHSLAIISGKPRERGKQYGQLRKDAIQAFLDKQVRRWVKNAAQGERYAGECGKRIKAFSPTIMDELEGMAEGTGLKLEEVVLLILDEELHGGFVRGGGLPKAAHCTALAAGPPDTSDGSTYVGQTWDWFRQHYGLSSMLLWKRPEGPGVLSYSYPGLWTAAGVNSAGLALCWTSAFWADKGGAKAPRVGIPTYVLIAQMLYQDTLTAAIEEVKRAQHAGWFTFVLADAKGGLANVEGSPEELAVEMTRGHLARYLYGGRQLTRTPKDKAVAQRPRCRRMYQLLQSSKGKLDRAIAPGANILLVEANTNSWSDLMAGVNWARNQPGVSTVSMSFGGPGSGYDSSFTTPSGHNGVTFLAASGDSGSSGGVNYPAASPNVVGVGGTQLNVDSYGDYLSESGWSGSGGGISSYAQPSYQQGVVTQSTTYRTVPDVAYNASGSSPVPIYDTSGYGGWLQVYGTSMGAPQWAGLIAIADQGRALAGKGTLDGRTETLPGLYSHTADFHDITTGSNGAYSAGPGYDLVTGIGSPRANLLVPDLVAYGGVTQTLTSIAVSPASASVVAGGTQQFTATALDQNGNPMATQPAFTWSIDSGGIGTISSTGLYTAPATGTGSATVRATADGLSNTASVTITAPQTLPAAPSNLSAVLKTKGHLQINLAWTDNSNNESGFGIQRSANGGSTWTTIATVGASSTSYADRTISKGTTYSYRVYAYNSAGNSAYSNVATVTTPSVAGVSSPSRGASPGVYLADSLAADLLMNSTDFSAVGYLVSGRHSKKE